MKCIHIFLASSIVEFEKERNELGNYIRSLNDVYYERNIYFKLTMCENLSSAVELEGKQNFYNSKIREADYFYVIFGKKAGRHTLEEFEIAMEQFRSTGKPKIYTYFRQFSDKNTSQEVLSFMQRLDHELGHYYSMFTHIDSIKLNILLEFARDPQIGCQIEVENGQLCVDGDRVLSLQNIPGYSQNAQLNQFRGQMKTLDEEFAAAAAAYGTDPTNGELLQKMMDLGHQRGKLADMIRQMEKDILELYTTVSLLKRETRPLNWWEREASRLLELGNSEGALQILRDVQLQKELEQAKDMVELNKERIRSVIRAKKMVIQVLRTRGLTAENTQEIDENYDQIVATAEEYHIEMDSLYAYADFAYSRRDLGKAEQLLSKLLAWYRYQGQEDELYRDALLLQSIVFALTEQFDAAEKGFLELLQQYSEADAINIANINNSLGMMKCTQMRLEEAEQYSLTAVALMRKIAEEQPTIENRNCLADYCNTLSQIYSKLDRFDDGKKLAEDIYCISKELRQEDPDGYNVRYAKNCAHYSMFLTSPEEFSQSEALLLEALDILKKASQQSPATHLPGVIWVMYLLGGKYYDRNNAKAYRYYSDAYDLMMQLPKSVQEHLTVNTTLLCSNLAVLLIWRGETERAEKMLLNVLQSNEHSYAAHPDMYRIPLGECYNNLMLFYRNFGELQESLNYGEKARKLVEEAVKATQTPSSDLLNLLATTYFNYATVQKFGKNTEIHDVYMMQSRYIWGQLRQTHGATFDRSYFKTASTCAQIYERKEDRDAALGILAEACVFYMNLEEPCHELSTISALMLPHLIERDNLEEAEHLSYAIMELMQQGYSEDARTYGIHYAQACNNVAAVLSRCKNAKERLDEICKLYGEAVGGFCVVCEEDHGENLKPLMTSYNNLLRCMNSLGDYEGALTTTQCMIERLIRWAERSAATYEPYLARAYYDQAHILHQQFNDRKQAKELLCKALNLAQKHPHAQALAQAVEQILKEHFTD